MKKWIALVVIVNLFGVMLAIMASDKASADYSRVERMAQNVIGDSPDIYNFNIKISEDEVTVSYNCSKDDVLMTVAEVAGVYAGIVDYAPGVGDLHASAFDSNGRRIIHYSCLKSWVIDCNNDQKAHESLDRVFGTITWFEGVER